MITDDVTCLQDPEMERTKRLEVSWLFESINAYLSLRFRFPVD